MSEHSSARRFAGHLVLTGVMCLFIALVFALGAMGIEGPAGGMFLTLAKLFGVLWFPLIATGVVIRLMTAPPREEVGAEPSHDAAEEGTAAGRRRR